MSAFGTFRKWRSRNVMSVHKDRTDINLKPTTSEIDPEANIGCGFAYRKPWDIGGCASALLRLDAGRADHLVHFPVSPEMSLPNSAGEPGSGSPPLFPSLDDIAETHHHIHLRTATLTVGIFLITIDPSG